MFVALAALALVAAGCGDDDEDPAASDTSTTEAPAECTGEPIKLTTIVNRTGALVFGDLAAQADIGIEAALNAVNNECAIGRPIEVETCDEKSDANASTECGRTAVDDGSLAFIARTGLFPNGVDTAQLPALYANGGSQFELTSELALSSQSVISQLLACATYPVAGGFENVLFVSADTPEGQGSLPIIQELVGELGGSADAIFYPPDTTDFAPIAAQVQEKDPDAVCLVATGMVPLVNALADVGISASETPLVSATVLVTPEVIDELGDAAEGMYLVTQVIPPTATENAGIAQLREEVEAAGMNPDEEDLTTETVYYWSSIHTLADALAALTPEQIESLDSQTIYDAVKAHTPVERPEAGTVDFSKSAFADIPLLSAFRIFNRTAMMVQVEDGEYAQISDFVDVANPPPLEIP